MIKIRIIITVNCSLSLFVICSNDSAKVTPLEMYLITSVLYVVKLKPTQNTDEIFMVYYDNSSHYVTHKLFVYLNEFWIQGFRSCQC